MSIHNIYDITYLFSLYIDEITMRQKGIGVTCGNRLIPALLYADDMVLLAEDEKGMGESLEVLQEWCVDWSLRVNGSMQVWGNPLQKERRREE